MRVFFYGLLCAAWSACGPADVDLRIQASIPYTRIEPDGRKTQQVIVYDQTPTDIWIIKGGLYLRLNLVAVTAEGEETPGPDEVLWSSSDETAVELEWFRKDGYRVGSERGVFDYGPNPLLRDPATRLTFAYRSATARIRVHIAPDVRGIWQMLAEDFFAVIPLEQPMFSEVIEAPDGFLAGTVKNRRVFATMKPFGPDGATYVLEGRLTTSDTMSGSWVSNDGRSGNWEAERTAILETEGQE